MELKNRPQAESQSEWIGLAEAARALGVHITTLRRWADSGKIAHIRTPGGKRRFSWTDLQAFQEGIYQAETANSSNRSLKTLELALTEAGASQTHRQLQEVQSPQEPWKAHMSPELQQSFRHSGQLLMALLMQYNCRSDEAESFLVECRQEASSYAALCRQVGMSLGETVQTFLFFRRSILESIHETSTIEGQNDPESRRIFQRTNHFLDQFLLELVKGFER